MFQLNECIQSHLDVSTTEIQSQNNTCSVMDIDDPSLLGSSKLISQSQPSIRESTDQKQVRSHQTFMFRSSGHIAEENYFDESKSLTC
jgi:hypothetical protein